MFVAVHAQDGAEHPVIERTRRYPASRHVFPLQTPHTAAKYGVVGLTLALANELAAQNVRVNTVLPTGVPTGMIPPSFGPLLGEQRSDLIPIFVNAVPTPAVEPVDVSNAVLFLMSDESRYVTGLQFKVDAGVTIN